MTLMVNTDTQTRVWPGLCRAEAKTETESADVDGMKVDMTTEVADVGSTLELAAGEQAEVDVPDGFDDPYLQPAKPKRAKPDPAPEPAPSH